VPKYNGDYYKAFAHLRTDTNPTRWSATTNHRAPHKPLLLLAVMDLIAQGVIGTNFIGPSPSLVDVVDLYWTKVIGQANASSLILPFSHLQSDGFWRLVPVPDMETALVATRHIRTFTQLRQMVLGAKLDDLLFMLLLDAHERDRLRRVLIETYFAPELRAKLVEVSQIMAESFEYSRELLDRARGRFSLHEAPTTQEQYLSESRSTAFRRVVVDAYDHTCALCGIRIVTPEGRTAVAAAHIVPWSLSHNDDPRNGMTLCGLHHWTFDQGIVGVRHDYHIKVSSIISKDDERIQPLLTLDNQVLQRPADNTLWPAEEAVRWHTKNVYRP